MLNCSKCGKDITGTLHHSGERGMPFCCECGHPPPSCSAESSSGRTSAFEVESASSSLASANIEPCPWECPFERIRNYPGCFEDCPDTEQCRQPSTAEPVIAVNIKGKTNGKKKSVDLTSKTGATGQAVAPNYGGGLPPEGERGASIEKLADSGQIKQECEETLPLPPKSTGNIRGGKMPEEENKPEVRISVDYKPGRWGKTLHLFDLDNQEIVLHQKDAVKLAKAILKIVEH